jgi:hypothetical protein
MTIIVGADSLEDIEKLKKEARKHILRYNAIAEEYSCGLALAEHISFAMRFHKEEFNRIMDELAKLDPETPKFRL